MHDVKPITAKIIADVLDDLEAENCQRLADGQAEPILPVSLHYFLRDGKTAAPIPDDVTEADRRLQGRASRRAAAIATDADRRPDRASPKPTRPPLQITCRDNDLKSLRIGLTTTSNHIRFRALRPG